MRYVLPLLLFLRPGLGLQDLRGHLMKAFALPSDNKILALSAQVLALALKSEKVQQALEVE